jgi:hypothetical protein
MSLSKKLLLKIAVVSNDIYHYGKYIRNIMAKKLITCFILLEIILMGCASVQQHPVLLTSPIVTMGVIEPNSSPIPIEKIAPTITPLASTLTPFATITPINFGEAIVSQCIKMNSELPQEIVPKGVLVVNTLGHGISLISFKSQSQRERAGTFIAVGTSPDGKWLVYNTNVDKQFRLVFEPINGGKTIQIPKDLNWSLVKEIRWLDQQRIWFPEISTIQPATSVVVLDPFTNQRTLLKTDYPGVMHYNFGSDPLGYHFGYSSSVYDPSLNYVIYPQFEQGAGYFQTLMERKTQKVIVKVPSSGYYQNLPIWQDGKKQFLVVGFPESDKRQNEWLSVGLDGIFHQISSFGKMGRKYTIENNAALSPDGRTLAFTLSIKKDDMTTVESSHLVLLNLENGNTVDTCLSVKKITWSIDGRYLAVSTLPEDGTHNNILLIDLIANQGYQLMDGSQLLPVGWLLDP